MNKLLDFLLKWHSLLLHPPIFFSLICLKVFFILSKVDTQQQQKKRQGQHKRTVNECGMKVIFYKIMHAKIVHPQCLDTVFEYCL